MLDMADDASGLLASLRASRSKETGTDTAGSGVPWLDYVLEDGAAQRVAVLRQAIDAHSDVSFLVGTARGILPDTSDLAAALNALLVEAGSDLARCRKLQALLAELDARVEQESPDGTAMMRAGLNAAVSARTFARRMSTSRKALRTSYRHFLTADLDPTLLYQMWIQQYGFDKRLGVLEFIEQALAADIYALDPSCARREFGNLLTYARQLTLLRSADSHLMACPWQAILRGKTGLDEAQWMAAIFAILRDGPDRSVELRHLLEAGRLVLSTSEKSALLVSLRRILQRMPHQMWRDVDAQAETVARLDVWIDAATRVEIGPGMHVSVEVA